MIMFCHRISPLSFLSLVLTSLVIFLFFYCPAPHRALPSFPTRRSSDLPDARHRERDQNQDDDGQAGEDHGLLPSAARDRKSTRLNSSHVSISYAVFCLKKKKKQKHN